MVNLISLSKLNVAREPLYFNEMTYYHAFSLMNVLHKMVYRNESIMKSNEILIEGIEHEEKQEPDFIEKNMSQAMKAFLEQKMKRNEKYRDLIDDEVKFDEEKDYLYYNIFNRLQSEYLLQKNNQHYHLMMKRIYENFFLIQNNGLETYNLFYLPFTVKENKEWIKKLDEEKIIDENVDLFIDNYLYLENELLNTFFRDLGYEVNIYRNMNENRNFNENEIIEMRKELLAERYTQEEVFYSPEYLWELTEEQFTQMDDEVKMNVWKIAYMSMDMNLLQKVNKFNHGCIFTIIQQKHPIVIFDAIVQQISNIKLYNFHNFICTGMTLDYAVKHTDYIQANSKAIVIDFFSKLNFYPQFNKLMQYQMEKIPAEYQKYSNEPLSFNPLEMYENLLNISKD